MTDNRNIADYYKYWETESIKTNLDTKRHNFGILATNIQGDFNLGSIIRNSNAFLAREVYIYGRKKFDRRATVGTHHYTNLHHVKEVDDLPNIPIISIDNVPGAVPMETFVWPDSYFLMAFGEENSGIPQELLDKSSNVVYITQYGSVRSLNVGCASGIAMYDFLRKMK